MTTRARAYLLIAAIRHTLMGILAVGSPQMFRNQSYIPLFDVAPVQFWGLIFLSAGGACGLAVLYSNEFMARLGMTWSATTTAMIAAGLVIAGFTGDLLAPIAPVLWAALASKDFVMCAQPMRSPFEVLVEHVEGPAKRKKVRSII